MLSIQDLQLFSSLLISRLCLTVLRVSHNVLTLPFTEVYASQHQGREFSGVICSISKVHISISKSLSTLVNDLQTLLQSAPSECLPRITHVSENGFSLDMCILQLPVPLWGLRAWHLSVLPDLCPVLSSRDGGMGEPDSMTFPVGRITPECGHCWKESLILLHVNHDDSCLAQLNIDLPGNSGRESSLFTNFIPDILCTVKYSRRGKKQTDFIETHSRGVTITGTEASPKPSPANA